MITVISTTNNGDGTYTIQFSAPITNLNPGVDTIDPNILLYTPGGTAWFPITFNAPESGNSITVTAQSSWPDCTLLVLLDQPLDLSAGDVFETTIPTVTAT